MSLPRLIDRLLGPIVARLGFRVVQVYLERIGEVALSLDLAVKLRRLGLVPRYRVVVVAPPERVSNHCYLDYWRPHLKIVDRGLALRLLRTAAWSPHVGWSPGLDGNREIEVADVERAWAEAGYGRLLRLTREHERRGRLAVRELGLPQGAWFVTLHVREPGFLDETPDSHRWYRNADVETYLSAARRIVERGGWVVRLGDPTMKPLPTLERVVDYAHHPLRSAWLDVYLAAACRFILGSTSGMIVVAQTFGVPIAAANFVPAAAITKTPQDIFIPKLHRRMADGALLSFEEAMRPELAFQHDGRRISAVGIEMVDNTPDEIEGLADEMLDRLDGLRPYTAEDERLQERYRTLLRRFYANGGVSRVGRDFLRKHERLLPA